MTRALYRLGRWCAEHGWQVVVMWILALLVIGGLNRGLGSPAEESYNLSGTDSWTAVDMLGRAFPGVTGEAAPLLIHTPDLDLTSPQGQRLVAAVVAAQEQVPDVREVLGPADVDGLVSDDGHTAQLRIKVAVGSGGDPGLAQSLLDAGRAAAGEGAQVELGGFLGRSLSSPSTQLSEVLGLSAAVLVLLITLRRVLASLVPLANAMLAVGVGLALVGLLAKLVYIPDVAASLGIMLGLGVGIDYALFLVYRHRILLRQGFELSDSVGRTAGTAGAAMVFAGATLVAAVAGLVLTGLSFLAWLGIAAAIVVSVAVLAAITLVPAMLGIVGRRVLPRSQADEVPDDAALDSSRWSQLADAVTRRPWLFAITSTAVLLLMAAPALTLSLGHSDASVLPETTTARQADDLIRSGFGEGDAAPLLVVSQMLRVASPPEGDTTSGGDPRTRDPRLAALREALRATPGVVEVDDPVVSTDGGIASVRVVPQWGSSDPRTEALVHDLRDRVLPPVDSGRAMESHVGGITAINIDLAELIAARTPWFIFGVVSIAFVLLLLAYRSLLIPLKAAAMNLLSIAAAYGVVTVIFQWGWGAGLIGLAGPVPIDSFVPMMIFAVLFGLSMDYEVFLLTAFREQWERTGDMVVSVRRGLADTGRIVTAAALIMIVVFASFIVSTDPTVKIFGVGLATAVAVDATIVRCLLVPAIMVLAAKGTWWLPGWLDRLLPQVHVEGDPAQIPTEQAAPSAPRPGVLVRRRPRLALGALLGAVAGFVGVWLVVGRADSAAVATAAVLGSLVVALPAAATGGRDGLGRRSAGLVLGALVALAVGAAATAFVPPALSAGQFGPTIALVGVALLAVLVLSRSLAVAALLGGLVVCVAALTSEAAFTPAVLVISLLPALVAALVTAAVAGPAIEAPSAAAADAPVDEPAPMVAP